MTCGVNPSLKSGSQGTRLGPKEYGSAVEGGEHTGGPLVPCDPLADIRPPGPSLPPPTQQHLPEFAQSGLWCGRSQVALVSLSLSSNVYLFIFETEKEGGRGSEAGSTLTAQSPTWGSNPQTMRS